MSEGVGPRANQTIVLETPRLILRELAPDDVDALHEVLGDAEIMTFYPHPFSREEVAGWIERAMRGYAERGFALWGVVERASGRLVGDTGPTVQAVDGEDLVEVGWHVHRVWQRRGFATEAGRACRDHALDALGLDRVILIRPDNVPSAGVARNLGMRVWKQAMHAGLVHDVWRIDREDPRQA